MDPEELARQAEARLAAIAAGGDPPPDPVDPPAEGDPPAEDPPAADPPAEGDPPAEDPPAEPPAARRGSRTLEARIGKLAGDKRTLEARVAAQEAELARLRAAPPADPPAEDPPAPVRQDFRNQADFNTAVQAEAIRQAELADWNNRCNAVEDTGAKLGERWQAAKRSLALLDDNGVIPHAILALALETPHPDQVILTLGEDPDRASELLNMSPMKRAMEIAKMAGPAKAPARSAAPPPVDPLRGRGAPTTLEPSDRDTDEEWARKRNAQIEAKRIAEAARLRSMS